MIPSIELIRLIAVVFITFTHTRHEFESGTFFFIIEVLPTYGTAILSIISGYLYYVISRKKPNLFLKKVKSLAIPYLIANAVVLGMVLLFNFVVGYNPLNRLTYDYTLLTEGLFSLNMPPVNPPTYFIRDIFILFSMLALFTQKSFKSLLVLIPVMIFGTLFLRWDIVFLFIVGALFAAVKDKFHKKYFLIGSGLLVLIMAIGFENYLKFPISFFVFGLMLDLKIKFFNSGRFTYLLHLYHSPIIVISYPILNQYISNGMLKVILQIIISVCCVYLLFLATKRIKALRILSGGR